ncbi:MAG: hypothetical protein QXL31_06715 [Thermosphaera sp.]
MRWLAAILLAFLVAASFIAPTSAQAHYEIKYRVVGDLKPGNEVYFHLMMARVSASGEMRPVTDAVFTVILNGREKMTLKADEEGIVTVPVRVSSLSLLGSTITLDVEAKSEMYGAEASRRIIERVEPDAFALLSIMLGALSLLIPVIMIRRVGA